MSLLIGQIRSNISELISRRAKKFNIDTDIVKRKFYASCNSILGKSRNIDEITRLSLVQAYCLPILLYASLALSLTGLQVNDLNIAWNIIYRNISGYHKWESVRELNIVCLDNLDLKQLRI